MLQQNWDAVIGKFKYRQLIFEMFVKFLCCCLRFFDTVGSAVGWASGLQKKTVYWYAGDELCTSNIGITDTSIMQQLAIYTE